MRENSRTPIVKRRDSLKFRLSGFRPPPPAQSTTLAVENILNRLGERKMQACIRTVEEVDREKLASYDEATLLDVGCERTKVLAGVQKRVREPLTANPRTRR